MIPMIETSASSQRTIDTSRHSAKSGRSLGQRSTVIVWTGGFCMWMRGRQGTESWSDESVAARHIAPEFLLAGTGARREIGSSLLAVRYARALMPGADPNGER